MDREILNELNNLAIELKSTKDRQIVDQIKRKLIHLEFQIELFRYKMRIIDDFNLKKSNSEFSKYNSLLSSDNALTKNHLIIPLLLYLLQNHRQRHSAYETAIKFMNESVDYLREGDFARLKTGSQRFVTNSRFASDFLRKYGFLRSDNKVFYKIWELSPFGLIVAANIFIDHYKKLAAYILMERDKYSVEFHTLNILEKYSRISSSLDNFYSLICYAKEEEKIMHTYSDDVSNFYNKFLRVFSATIDSGTLSLKTSTTIDFINLLKDFNGDLGFSMLADDLVLRKEIEVNLGDVYKIIYENYKL